MPWLGGILKSWRAIGALSPNNWNDENDCLMSRASRAHAGFGLAVAGLELDVPFYPPASSTMFCA
jgi:hypothetical protein